MKIPSLIAVAASLVLPASSLSAYDLNTAVVRITGRVPTICRVEFSQSTVSHDAGTLDLGTMNEFCNSAEGYRVVMVHPAGLAGARAFVGGRVVMLSSGTETTLVDSDIPKWEQSSVQVDLGSESPDLASLTFRTEPKGMTY